MSNKPIPLRPDFSNFPAELQSLPNWVMWRYLPPKSNGGKWPKVPFQPNGKTASTTDRSTWSSFDDCRVAYTQGGFDGVGFVFDGEVGADGHCYCGVDFDACIDENRKIQSLAGARVKRLKTYAECSVSGTGLHCIARAKPLDRIVKYDGVEIYTEKRFFTFTGGPLGGAFGKIESAEAEVQSLVDEVRAKEASAKKQFTKNTKSNDRSGNSWIQSASPEQLDQIVDHALAMISQNSCLLELEANHGNNAEYFKLTTSVARSGAPYAEDIFVKYASAAKNADPEEELRRHFARCSASPLSGDQPITVGTLLHLARQCGATFSKWKLKACDGATAEVRFIPGNEAAGRKALDKMVAADLAEDNALSPRLPAATHVPQNVEEKTNPVSDLMALHAKGASLNSQFLAMNKTYAVVKYGTQILVASIIDDDICLMKVEDFHKMLANLVVPIGNKEIAVSRLWFKWEDRRQYLRAGVVFQPGGPPEIKGDMLNLWCGFGIKPMPGSWSLLRDHIFKEVCSGRQEHFDYLIRWMAYAVQHPDRPMGVAVAFLGAQGAGKGIVARTFGKFFGKHFAHIANGDQLTGRFNASIGMSCAVFLDEALWAGDKKGEGVLKALITEPSLQLEAKFRDPIRVENRLRIIVASNNDWAIPAGVGDRRWFVLYVTDTYAGIAHQDYWDAVYSQIEHGGAAAMLHDLLSMDISSFNVRAIPHTAAKALQQVHSLHGTQAWLHHILHEGSVGGERWQDTGLTIDTDQAYTGYEDFSKRQREWRPDIKSVWSKKIHAALGPHIDTTRRTIGGGRVRSFQFAPLADCRQQFAFHLGAPDLDWDEEKQPDNQLLAVPEGLWDYEEDYLDDPNDEWEPETDPEPDYETEDEPPD
jgi:Family of unknown function (DUF5906)